MKTPTSSADAQEHERRLGVIVGWLADLPDEEAEKRIPEIAEKWRMRATELRALVHERQERQEIALAPVSTLESPEQGAAMVDSCPRCGSPLRDDPEMVWCSGGHCRYARLVRLGNRGKARQSGGDGAPGEEWEEDTATTVPLAETDDPAYSATRLRTVRASDVEPEAVKWLWDRRIPLGKVTILAGDPDQGKSVVMCDIVAKVTRGKALPGDNASIGPANALIISGEDGAADTIRPRLEAADADLSRVDIMEGVTGPGGQKQLDLKNAEHLKAIEAAIRRREYALVVIDPLFAYLGRTDSYKDAEVRAVLTPLAEIADQRDAAIVSVVHFRKSEAVRVLYKISGSVAFGAAPRSALVAGSDPDQEDSHALAHIKSNLSKKAPSIGYRLVERTIRAKDGGAIETVAVEWTGESDLTAERMVASPDAEGPTAREEAKEFIRGMLGGGRVPAVEVLKAWKTEGHHSETTLRRAARDLNVDHPREGFGAGSTLYWELPT